jgi:ubiquitin-conjugating enzyme E2 Z
MTSLCLKRIMIDISNIQKDPIDIEKIFIYQDPENIFNVKILMIGDEDTPYEFGIFYFNLVFPENYPYSPPNMKFITSNGKTRFNPNLYIGGKICISLLNTWQGPKWTACNTLKSILLSIKSMILGTRYPLENEPGYELSASKKKTLDPSSIYIKYNSIIEYQVLLHTIIKQYLDPPVGMDVAALDIQ